MSRDGLGNAVFNLQTHILVNNHREASSLLQRRVYLYEQHCRYRAFCMLQGDYWRMPRPLTSKRAQAMHSTIVATTIKVSATLILMSETPRMP